MKNSDENTVNLSFRKKVTFTLLAGLVFSFFFYFYLLFPIFVMLLIVHVFHNLFYLEPKKLFWFYTGLTVVLGILYWLRIIPYIAYTSLLIFFAVFECLRVLMMAIINYPQSIQDLKDLNEKLEERVRERTGELQRANEKLLELDKMKSAFVSQASHDLRTPLTAIKGSLDNLSLGVAGDLSEKQKKVLDRALRSVDRLTNLINDILDLSRIESGRVILKKSQISLKAVVESTLHEVKPAADAKTIHINRIETDSPLFIMGDNGKIERVVNELICNAIKYTPEGGSVEVCLEERDGYAFLFVKDTGIGMTQEETKRIWDRFYRTPDSQNMAKGSGLGLSIAKELIELHEGSIHVESEKGKGTTFIVILPRYTKNENHK